MAHSGSNKARNQTRAGGTTNAKWLENNKSQSRRRGKMAKQSRRANRKK